MNRADQAATTCEGVLTAGMTPSELSAAPPVLRATFCHLTDSHTLTNHSTQLNDTTCSNSARSQGHRDACSERAAPLVRRESRWPWRKPRPRAPWHMGITRNHPGVDPRGGGGLPPPATPNLPPQPSHTLLAGQSSRREGGGRGDSHVAPGLANGSGTSQFQPRASTAPCI